MKNNSCLNRSWTDETNFCLMEAGSMKRILTKVEAGLMKNNATNTKYLPIIKPAKTIDYPIIL